VRSIVELGHGLGLAVVAEGIETPQVWAQLLRLGCDLAQGYFVSRPLASPDVVGWVKTRQSSISKELSEADVERRLVDLSAFR
jgi:EAL domain-containing protein (putative c-di-GMP-specific phosphodiesterase class I)